MRRGASIVLLILGAWLLTCGSMMSWIDVGQGALIGWAMGWKADPALTAAGQVGILLEEGPVPHVDPAAVGALA